MRCNGQLSRVGLRIFVIFFDKTNKKRYMYKAELAAYLVQCVNFKYGFTFKSAYYLSPETDSYKIYFS